MIWMKTQMSSNVLDDSENKQTRRHPWRAELGPPFWFWPKTLRNGWLATLPESAEEKTFGYPRVPGQLDLTPRFSEAKQRVDAQPDIGGQMGDLWKYKVVLAGPADARAFKWIFSL